MRDIEALSARQVRIFEADVVPYRVLRTGVGVEYLKNAFSFRETVSAEGELGFLAGGFLLPETQELLAINFMTINERKIVIEVAGNTAQADALFAEIRRVAWHGHPDSELHLREPLITAHETQCSVTMDFDWDALLNQLLASYMKGPALAALPGRSSHATARIKHLSLRFTIGFTTDAHNLLDSGITLSDKPVVIEPRVDTPLKDRRYFTASPLDTESHMQLLAELERSILGGRRKPAAKQQPS